MLKSETQFSDRTSPSSQVVGLKDQGGPAVLENSLNLYYTVLYSMVSLNLQPPLSPEHTT